MTAEQVLVLTAGIDVGLFSALALLYCRARTQYDEGLHGPLIDLIGWVNGGSLILQWSLS